MEVVNIIWYNILGVARVGICRPFGWQQCCATCLPVAFFVRLPVKGEHIIWLEKKVKIIKPEPLILIPEQWRSKRLNLRISPRIRKSGESKNNITKRGSRLFLCAKV